MPTYQYRCTDCGRDLEVVQKFSDATLTQCPACQGQLRKIFNAVGVVFKGSGFYRTDSRKGVSDGDSGGNSADGTSGAEKKSETKTEKKSDSTSGDAGKTGDKGSSTPAKTSSSPSSTGASSAA